MEKSKLGDLWQLGRHKLLCGDCFDGRNIARVCRGTGLVDMTFTDPPFEMQDTEYMKYLLKRTVGAVLVMHSDKNMVLLAAEYRASFRYFLVHYYPFGFPKKRSAPQMSHHLIGVFGKPKFNNKSDGFKTVLEEPLVMGKKKIFTYQKKVELVEACITHYSKAGNSVLDTFGGSGTTLIACEMSGRTCCMVEKVPDNCDMILERWVFFTGQIPEKITK